jgi:hypothetical protein
MDSKGWISKKIRGYLIEFPDGRTARQISIRTGIKLGVVKYWLSRFGKTVDRNPHGKRWITDSTKVGVLELATTAPETPEEPTSRKPICSSAQAIFEYSEGKEV